MTNIEKIKLPLLLNDKFFVTENFHRGNFFSKKPQKHLAVKKMFPIFAVPKQFESFGQSKESLDKTAISGLPCTSNTPKYSSCFGEQREARLFLHTANFSVLMPKQTKNCRNMANNSSHSAQTQPQKTPFYSRGRYIQLKGRLNKVEREYVHILAAYNNEKLLREYLQKEVSYFMSLSSRRTEMLIANLNR